MMVVSGRTLCLLQICDCYFSQIAIAQSLLWNMRRCSDTLPVHLTRAKVWSKLRTCWPLEEGFHCLYSSSFRKKKPSSLDKSAA